MENRLPPAIKASSHTGGRAATTPPRHPDMTAHCKVWQEPYQDLLSKSFPRLQRVGGRPMVRPSRLPEQARRLHQQSRHNQPLSRLDFWAPVSYNTIGPFSTRTLVPDIPVENESRVPGCERHAL